MWRLVGIQGVYKGQYFDLSGERIVLGRNASNGVVLDRDESVSDSQAALEMKDGAYMFRDIADSCPSSVNGIPAKEPVVLRGDDSVQIGESIFRVEWHGAPQVSPAAAPVPTYETPATSAYANPSAPAYAAPPQQYTPPTANSGLALASLILGCLGFVTGGLGSILGLILGLVGLKQINRSGGQLGGQGLATAGIAVSGVGICILPLMLAIAIPNFIRARECSMARQCQLNIRTIEMAKIQWARENEIQTSTSTPTNQDLSRYLPKMPACPGHGEYTIGDMGSLPTCSIGEQRPGAWDDHKLYLQQPQR